MAKRLTAKSIRYAINQLEKGRISSVVAAELEVTPRHIRRLHAEFRKTEHAHIPRAPGRPAIPPPSPDEVQLVLDAYRLEEVGVLRTAISLRRAGHNISYQRVCQIMKESGLVPSEAKSRKRKWVRYERKHSNSMWHTDWHVMKSSRIRGLCLITFLDDASRCVTGAGLCTQATSDNAVVVLQQAIKQFGTPATILSDNGSCFVGMRKGNPKGYWKPTAFEEALLGRSIELINSRPYHPQTNGKLERFHRTIEEEIGHYESLPEYIEYYNERRFHFSLDIANYETPLKAFSAKKATEETKAKDPNWMEAESND